MIGDEYIRPEIEKNEDGLTQASCLVKGCSWRSGFLRFRGWALLDHSRHFEANHTKTQVNHPRKGIHYE